MAGRNSETKEMESRLRRFITVALIVFVVINVLAIFFVLNNYFSSTANATSFLRYTNPANNEPTTDGTSTPDATYVAKPLNIALPTRLSSLDDMIIHFEADNENCAKQVDAILNKWSIPQDTELIDMSDPIDRQTGFAAIKYGAITSVSGINNLLKALGEINDTVNCLDRSSVAVNPNSETIPKGEVTGTGYVTALFEEDEESDDETDWLEYESGVVLSLEQSVVTTNAKIVHDDPSIGGLGLTGAGRTICVIDSGTQVIPAHDALPASKIKVGYNSNPGSGNEKYFYLGDNKYKNSIGIIQDKNPDSHGTKIHGIIGGYTSPPIPVSGSNTKTVGMAYGADFIIARATDFPEVGAGKSLKSIILKDIKNGCSDKNPWNKDADVIVLGISIPKKDGTPFTESWQAYGKKNPANKDQKGKKDDKINSFDKLMKKRFKKSSSKYNATTNPVMTPLVVPVGNKVGGKAGTVNGVTNSLAFSEFAIGVGSVADEDLATISTGDASLPCTDTTVGTNEVLCNSACHVDSAGGSVITVMAPGAMVFTPTGIPSIGAFEFNPYGLAFAGTSAAAAHVGGAVALMKQADPALSASQIKTMLKNTATKTAASGNTWSTEFSVPASCYGSGILNTHAAVLAAQSP